jgi:nitrite reductase/ring-hydroxylating ferredoxin subunit
MNQRFNGYAQNTAATEDVELTHVLPGTPCGELMRRFWQPVAMSSELVPDRPLRVRLLGEDLVLFRDRSGSLGLLHLHCSHRRSSLEFGIVSEHGIRCCYHGWLFDVDGTILETPGEPATSQIRKNVCHGAYPTHEYKGLIFAYLGPPDQKPAFPVFDTFEQPGTEMVPYAYEYPCNWLQTAENVVDPIHTVFLHTRISGTQFSDAFGEMPQVVWREMPNGAGIYLFNVRRVKQNIWIRMQESFRPNFSQTGDIWQSPDFEKVFERVGLSKWIVPLDNTHCRVIGWRYFNDRLDLAKRGDRSKVGKGSIDFDGQTENRDYEDKQRQPGDFEAIVSQGTINVHSGEHLGATDTGVGMVRYKLRQAIRQLANNEPLARPTLNGDGLCASYTQDTVLNIPPSGGDDVKLRRAIGEAVANIVIQSDRVPASQRREAIRRTILEQLGPAHPTIRLDGASANRRNESMEAV